MKQFQEDLINSQYEFYDNWDSYESSKRNNAKIFNNVWDKKLDEIK